MWFVCWTDGPIVGCGMGLCIPSGEYRSHRYSSEDLCVGEWRRASTPSAEPYATAYYDRGVESGKIYVLRSVRAARGPVWVPRPRLRRPRPFRRLKIRLSSCSTVQYIGNSDIATHTPRALAARNEMTCAHIERPPTHARFPLSRQRSPSRAPIWRLD